MKTWPPISCFRKPLKIDQKEETSQRLAISTDFVFEEILFIEDNNYDTHTFKLVNLANRTHNKVICVIY